jgi:hypothetical protein
VQAYWRQQVGYGKAEALLERKWPEKYNAGGHLTWRGRLYGDSTFVSGLRRRRARIYHGTWGGGLFQSVYQRRAGLLAALPSLPEWYLVIAVLTALSAIGAVWQPMLALLPLLGLAVGVLLVEAVMAATRASFASMPRTRSARLMLRSITALLYLLQPLARLWGRVQYGLTPWRRRGNTGVRVPRARSWTIWSERWRPPEEWLGRIEVALHENGATVLRGGSYDSWDLEVRGGALGSARIRALIEEHGGGRQLVRLRSYPCWSRVGFAAAALFALLSLVAELDRARPASVVLLSLAVVLVLRELQECAGATAEAVQAVEERTAQADVPRALRQAPAGHS